MADIKTITLPSGNTYNLVDQGARDLIAGLSGSTQFLGVTTTELVDGVTTNPTITVDGKSVTASAGGIATYGSKEFVYNGTTWQEFGDLSGLGALAHKSSASGNFTPHGSVSKPTFTGAETTSTGKFTPAGSVKISQGTGTANYTPTGNVGFTGSTSITPTISSAAGSSSNSTFRCGGTVGTPTITVTPSTDTVEGIDSVGTLPTWTATVSNENLTIGWSQGTLPTKSAEQTVVTGIQSAQSSQPTFSGSYIKLTSSAVDVPNAASFAGDGVELKAAFTGTEGNVSVKGTPGGDVSKPTFTGTEETVTVS